MRARPILKHGIHLVPLAILLMIFQLPSWVTLAEAQSPPSAVVIATQGSAYIEGPEEDKRQPLPQGAAVPAWQTVRTDNNSILMLQWEGDYLTSVGGDSTLFVSTRQIPDGLLTDVQLIDGVLRATSFGGGGRVSRPYGLTTPVAGIEPAALDTDVDFIVEVPESAVTVLTVLKGSVRVRSLTAEGSEEVTVGACQSVFVEEGKPVSNTAAVPPEALEKLVADTTIAGTELADVRVCGLGRVAREPAPAPAPAPPPDYYYVEEEYVEDSYPYDEIEVYPPEVAAGPMVVVLPGIGRWSLPYDVYHQWGFSPNVIRLYVSAVLCQNSLHYDYYYWNNLAVRQREYYDVLYPAQFANNTLLIAQTQHNLDFIRIRQNLMARRMQNLQARVAGLEQALSGRGGFRAPVLQALYNSLNSPRNINVARSFRQGIESRLRIQEQLAGNASDELFNLRRRMAQARNPQERLKLRDEMSQLRNVIRSGRLPLPGKDKDVRNLLAQIPKARDPQQLTNIQNQLAQQLGRPKVMAERDIVDPKRLEGLSRKIEKTASPEARMHVEKRIQDLQRNVQQRMEIESAQKEINRVVSQAAKTEDEAKRAELMSKIPGMVKPGQVPLKGALGDLREQQLLHSGIIGKPEKSKQDELNRRMQEFTKKQAEKLRPPVAGLTGEPGRKVQVPPGAEEAARKRAEDLKKRSEDARRKAEQMLKQKEAETRRGETPRALEQERLQRLKEQQEQQRKAAETERLRKDKERASQEPVQKQKEEQARQQRLKEQQDEQRKATEAERLRKERGRASQEAIQKQKEEQAKQQRLKEQQAEQSRRRDAERAKAQQQERQLRMQEEQRRKADERARDQQRQEQMRRQAEQARSREAERARAQQREQQMRQRQMEEQRARQQQQRDQQMRQRQVEEQRARQQQQQQQREQQLRQRQMEEQRARQQMQEQQMRQRQMQEQRMRQMQRPEPRGPQPGLPDPRRRTVPEQPGLPIR